MNEPHDANRTVDEPSAPVVNEANRTVDVPPAPDGPLDAGLAAGFGAQHSSLGEPRPPLLTAAEGASARPDAETLAGDLPAVPGYRVLREIARGGMGRVLAAHDPSLDRDVALKVLLPGTNADRFVRESKITARLPHPGIPPVHALGTLADGSPFLAMKLVAGRTLAEEMKSADRPRLLQTFTQVCQAVGFAHSRGIIHRDLKPANVMVGAFGEVQVMDWGLAKDRTSQEGAAEPRPSGPPTVAVLGTNAGQTTDHAGAGESTDERTQAGQVLGTPAYMAPEQARGETTDARSDVFALGGILCALLTGQPPYGGKSTLDVIRRAGAADLAEAHARLERCGADEELIALCRRCLSPHPEDRPADGQAVADQITAYLDGVQDRLRRAEMAQAEARAKAAEEAKRRRVLLGAGGVIAFVLLAGLGVSLWQMNVARQERDAKAQALEEVTRARALETKARQQAFAALRNMVTDVVERKFAKAKALTDEDRAFLRGVIAQFDAFAAIKGDDADSRAMRAEGRVCVGLMRHRLGEFQAAEQDVDQAVGIYEQLAADFPDRPELRHELAKSRSNRGNLLRSRGRLKEAEQEYEAALSMHKRLAADFPDRPEYRMELAGSHNNRGTLLRDKGRLKEAEQDYDAALSIFERLAADFPDRPEYREKLARSRNNRGVLLHDAGRLKEAEQDVDQAMGIYKKLMADYPGRPELRQELATTHNNRGLLMHALGRLKEMEQDNDQALVLYKRLAADFPTRPEFRQELANSYHGRIGLLVAAGQLKEAEEDCEAALAITRRLAADFPTRPEYRRELAASHNCRGIVLGQKGQLDEAVECFQKAIEGDPKNAHAHYHLGLVRQMTGKLDEAIACWKKTVVLDPKYSMAHHNLGLALLERGKVDEALECFRKAVAVDPKNGHYRYALGVALLESGKVDEAVACWKALIALRPKEPGLLAATRTVLATAEPLAALQDKLPAVLKGEYQPRTNDERVALAHLCRLKKLYRASADLLAAVFAEGPNLADDLRAVSRYHAAGYAALAGTGQGEDAGKLDKERARLRKQALDWLRADLTAWAKRLESGGPAGRAEVQTRLKHWQGDRNLAGIRDKAALEKLPEEERKAFAQLWADVAALLKKTEALTVREQPKYPKIDKKAEGKGQEEAAKLKRATKHLEAGQRDQALPLLVEVWESKKARLGPDHADTLNSMHELGVVYWQVGQFDRSVPLFEGLLKLREAKHGRGHPETLRSAANLGVNYKDAGQLREALALLEEAHRAVKKHPELAWVTPQLIHAYQKAGENGKAAALLLEQLPAARKALPKDGPQLGGLLAQIGQGLLEQKKWAQAEPLLRECLAIRAKAQPDHWSTFNARSMLGGALLGQKKYANAEPLLLAGYQGMKKREAKIPPPARPRLREAAERLVQLYEATGKKDEAARWRKELSALPAAKKPEKNKP
jgi:tetratricopeptide (TPR) repeat protein